jgi:hypothetical protein
VGKSYGEWLNMFDLDMASIIRESAIQRSRQEICILAFLNGIIITIKNYKLREDLAPTIEYGLEIFNDCIDNYPEVGDVQMNFLWIQGKVQKSQEFLGEDSESLYTAIVLVKLASLMVTDLVEKVNDNPKKFSYLEPIEELIAGLNDQLDPDGDQFEAYEKADEHLKKIYDLIGFTQ